MSTEQVLTVVTVKSLGRLNQTEEGSKVIWKVLVPAVGTEDNRYMTT